MSDRRRLLDLYGWYAWISPVIVLFLIYLGRISILKTKPFLGPVTSKTPLFIRVQYRRFSWLLDTPLPSDFGSVKVHLIGLFYFGWLLFLSVHRTGTDYMHLTKRLGHISVSQLPFQYLLSVKSPWSPIQLATNLTHETLNPYHRLSGQIILHLLLAHAVLYLNFFYSISALPRRLYDGDVQLGLLCLALLTSLAYTALRPNRRKAYHKYFYIPHVVLSLLLIPAISAHVPYTRKYMLQAAVVYVFNVVTRKSNTIKPPIPATVTFTPGTKNGLLRVSMPLPEPPFGSSIPTWVPGQHVYLKSGHNPACPRSPFTIVSLPPWLSLPNVHTEESVYRGQQLPQMELMVRNLGGPTTAHLASMAGEAGKNKINGPIHVRNFGRFGPPVSTTPAPQGGEGANEILVEGPYGTSTLVSELLASFSSPNSESDATTALEKEIVLLLAGGIGATYTLPIYVSLLETLAGNRTLNMVKKREMGRQVHFHWIVRSRVDAQWGIEYLAEAWGRINRKVGDPPSAAEERQHHGCIDGEENNKEETQRGDDSGDEDLPLNATIHITRAEESKEDVEYASTQSEKHAAAATTSQPSSNIQRPDSEKQYQGNKHNDMGHDTLPRGLKIITPPKPPQPQTQPSTDISTSHRPDLATILNGVYPRTKATTTTTDPPNNPTDINLPHTTDDKSRSTLTILTCGPTSLTDAVHVQLGRRRQLDVDVDVDMEVRWHNEGFGLGERRRRTES